MNVSQKTSRVVVTGVGIVSSLGMNKMEFWDNIRAGKCGFSSIESFDTSKFSRNIGAEVRHFNPLNYFSPDSQIDKIGRGKQMAAVATLECLRDANAINNENLYSATAAVDAGVALGTTYGEAGILQKIGNYIESGNTATVPSHLFPDYYPSSIPQAIGQIFGIQGMNIMIPNACAAGNFAICYSVEMIRQGVVKSMVAGGVDVFSRTALAGFSKVNAVSPDVPRPFSKNRQGLIPGEGAGVLFIESFESAKDRGARIYAEIIGYGISADAWHITQPSAEGISRAIRDAINDAHIDLSEISCVSAHGTGTITNDPTEVAALKMIFGQRLTTVPVFSLKSMLGHCMGAASAIECVASVLALQNHFIPPTINFLEKEPACDIDCVPNKGREIPISVLLKTASAFGGNNAALLFKHIE